MWQFEKTKLKLKTRREYETEIETLLNKCAIYVDDLKPYYSFPAVTLHSKGINILTFSYRFHDTILDLLKIS